MEYTEIKLNVSNDNIKEYKLFDGIKIYSDIFISEDKKSLTNKKVYITSNIILCLILFVSKLKSYLFLSFQ